MTARTLVASRRAALALAVATTALLASTPHASAWTVTPTILNHTGSTAQNCPSSMTGGSSAVGGCVLPSNLVSDDSRWLITPTAVPNVPFPGHIGTATLGDSLSGDGGVDGWVDYSMPDGATYNLVFENDEDADSSGSSGNYVACVEENGQGSAYGCAPAWSTAADAYVAAMPVVTFVGNDGAPTLAVGQQCSATMTAGETFNCTTAGMWPAPTVTSGFTATIVFENLGTSAVSVNESQFDTSCPMPSNGDKCGWSLVTNDGLGDLSLVASTAGDYGVEVVSFATGLNPPSSNPSTPTTGSAAVSAQRKPRTFRIPAGTRTELPSPVVSRLAVTPPRGRRAGSVRWHTNVEGTTALSFAKRVRGRWVTLPGRKVVTGLFRTGARPFTLRGHASERAAKGAVRSPLPRKLAGRRLRPGRYRVTAVERARGSSRTSRPAHATFKIRRRVGTRLGVTADAVDRRVTRVALRPDRATAR